MIGASLLAGAASLPLHIMPLLVVAAASAGRLPASEAGWIATAYMLGQMGATLALPAAGFSRLSRSQGALAAISLISLVFVSAQLATTAFLTGWVAIGACCGALQFLATTAAANQANRHTAFSIRLGVTLLVSAVAVLIAQFAGAAREYGSMASQLATFLLAICVVGLAIYDAPRTSNAVRVPGAQQSAPRRIAGLCIIFCLFAGQIGFWAYAVQNAQARGLVLVHLALGIAVCKGASGVLLLARAGAAPSAHRGLGIPGSSVTVGIVCMAFAADAWVFFAGLLAWELGLNTLSARAQAQVVEDCPSLAGPWLAGATYLGAATGPVLQGLALEFGAPHVFWLAAGVSAMLPLLWASSRDGLKRQRA